MPWPGTALCAATASPCRCGRSTEPSAWAVISVTHVAGEQAEAEHVTRSGRRGPRSSSRCCLEIPSFADAVPLLTAVRDRGLTLVLASCGRRRSTSRPTWNWFDGQRLADDWTTSEDVASTKPAPDLVQAAMKKAAATSAVMIGDSTWDARAAGKLGVPTFAVRTGGFSDTELRDAGAVGVYDSLAGLQADLDRIIGGMALRPRAD